jgi:hypothetical protein
VLILQDKMKFMIQKEHMYAMMKLVIVSLIMVIGVGCSHDDDSSAKLKADDLFIKSCKLTESYCNKLKHAPDSASVAAIMEEYRERITKLNLQYPQDTDVLLTEGQNDTLVMLTNKLLTIRNQRLAPLDTTAECLRGPLLPGRVLRTDSL